MKLRPLLLPLLVFGGLLAGGAAAATLEGRVTLPKARTAPVMNKRYEIVSKGGVIATNPPLAVVYLDGEFPRTSEAPTVRMEQKDLVFVPQLLPVRVGTRVEFPNLDDTFHNIFSYSRTKRFDLGRYRGDEKPIPSVVFDTPGLVSLRCDIHEHMRGVILVLATPHFVITDNEGNYRLEGLPAGTYTLRAWLDSKTTLEKTVTLEADSRLQVDLP
jgi:plastocyanin